jgi:hypothetical protein
MADKAAGSLVSTPAWDGGTLMNSNRRIDAAPSFSPGRTDIIACGSRIHSTTSRVENEDHVSEESHFP